MRLRDFLYSQQGIAFVYFAVSMPALLGMIVIVIDISRGNNLQLDLQNAADALALAAAAELDGGSDAITRANRAIANLADNQARFGDDGAFIVDQISVPGTPGELVVRYLSDIPADDDTPIDANWIALHDAGGDPNNAHFAAVWAEPVDYSLLLPFDFIGQTTVGVGAHAVAGYRAVYCDVPPMYICNPYANYQQLEAAMLNIGTRRRLFKLRQGPGNHTNAGPGDYGFLRSPFGGGTNEIKEMLASSRPIACFSQQGVYLKPGQLGNAAASHVNVRFDIYDSAAKNLKDKAYYEPATNVRKGFKPPKGNPQPPDLYCTDEPKKKDGPGDGRMPRDTCFDDGDCPLLGGNGGDGYWKCLTYWNANHPSAHPPPPGCTDAEVNTIPSRFDVYMYEINQGHLSDQASNGETGNPGCYKGGTPPDNLRRVIIGAILKCPVLSEPTVPVAYASFLLTEPADHGSDTAFWGELVDITGRAGSGTLDGFERDDVQLYR